MLVLGGTGSELGDTDWYLVVLGQYKAVMVGIWLYLVSRGRRWLFLGITGSVSGGTAYQCDMLSENIWLTFCKPSKYSIFGEG